MPKAKVPEKVVEELKKVKDPHNNKSLYEEGMLKDITFDGKNIKMKLVPAAMGCAFCGVINIMLTDIEGRMKKLGYDSEVTVGF